MEANLPPEIDLSHADLRDVFAAFAMQGLIVHSGVSSAVMTSEGMMSSQDADEFVAQRNAEIAAHAYDLADQMIVQRISRRA